MAESSSRTPTVADEARRNGSASTTETPATQEQPAASEGCEAGKKAETSSVDRADAIIDNFADNVAAATSYIGKGLLRWWARTREEASDMWAEAQSIRRGDKS